MPYTLFDICRLARKLVTVDNLADRDAVIGKIVNPDEKKDEDYWAEGFKFDKSNLRVVSLVNSIWQPLKKIRKDLPLVYFDKPSGLDLYHKTMSYCKEYARKGEAAIIVQNADRRLCIQRFLEAKELLHLYTDTVTDRNTEVRFLSNVLLEQSMDGSKFIAEATKPLEPEAVGFYLAIEVLLPWCLREQLNEMLESHCPNFQIAKAYMVPEFIIRHVRSVQFDNVYYLGKSYLINRQLDSLELNAN